MKTLKEILNEVYQGTSMSKMTSISGNVVKFIQELSDAGKFHGNVIDYGCGKSARNANYIRSTTNDVNVYAYDPYWGTAGADPFTGISNILPNQRFDVGFTSYVLNVVTVSEEASILSWFDTHCDDKYHIVRNLDVNEMIRKALTRDDKIVTDFFLNIYGNDTEGKDEYGGTSQNIDRIKNKDEGWEIVVNNFARYGTKTSKGFQRVPYLEEHGYTVLKSTSGYKVYYKS
jgi:hypothetical protein